MDNFNQDNYLNYANNFENKLLNKKEVEDLMKQIKEGNEEESKFAKEKLVVHNLRLAFSIAKKYQGRGVDIMDLIQEANIGLLKSIDKFEVSKGYAFSTYATWWITASVRRYIQKNGTNIKVPAYINDKINKIETLIRESEKNGKKISEKKLAELMDASEEEIKFIRNSKNRTDVLSLDYENEKEDSMMQLLQSSKTVEDEALENDRKKVIIETVRKTCKTKRDAEILLKSFGIYGKFTLEEIGEMHQLSKERVRQIRDRELGRLKLLKNTTVPELVKCRNNLKDYL